MDLLENDSTLFCSVELDAESVANALDRVKSFVSQRRRVFVFEDGQPLDTVHLEPSGSWFSAAA
jgi:hypothetical protein